MRKRWKNIMAVFFVLFAVMAVMLIYFSRRPAEFSPEIRWGLTFSKMWTEELGLDPRSTYLAILNDLEPAALRLPVYWHDLEAVRGQYDFSYYDWLVEEAEKHGVQLTLAIGGKLPRWPECHDPYWASALAPGEREGALFALTAAIVERYRDSSALAAWQVENEPFLPFGECPTVRANFLELEIELVRSLDGLHPIITTDSGEFGMWLRAAFYGDIFGTTMYRVVYSEHLGYVYYPLSPRFFWLKENLLHLFYPQKEIIVSELQGEPWGPQAINEMPLEEQFRSMSIKQFRDNMDYARMVGIRDVYLWGAEWWYYLKEKHNEPAFWDEVRKTINN